MTTITVQPRRCFVPAMAVALCFAIAIATSGCSETSEHALKRIQAERRIIDVHEHIESAGQAAVMVAAMDALGIGKTVLMGSSWFTITLDPAIGFTRYDENNEELMRVCAQYPGRFEAWPTIDPRDPKHLDKFKELVGRGAVGLKLYLGHGYVNKTNNQYLFHTMAMDDPSLTPLYRYCQENFIPICLHVNPGPTTPGFADEFLSVLMQFPDMKVVCPHFMLSSIKDSRLHEFLDTFPNLYSDISFGHDDFFKPGLERISQHPAKFQALFARYPDRFMFSCDLVLTNVPFKDQKWMQDRMGAYLDMLAKHIYKAPTIGDKTLQGLELKPELLERVLYKNYEAMKAARPANTKITRPIDWSRMGAEHVDRKPGDSLPPPAQEGKKAKPAAD